MRGRSLYHPPKNTQSSDEQVGEAAVEILRRGLEQGKSFKRLDREKGSGLQLPEHQDSKMAGAGSSTGCAYQVTVKQVTR